MKTTPFFLFAEMLVANIFAVSLKEVLDPSFFNQDDRLYLTEESVISGQLGQTRSRGLSYAS